MASDAGDGGPVQPFEAPQDPTVSTGQIDAIVFGKLADLGIPREPLLRFRFCPARLSDVIGTLPTADEAASFIGDTHPDKRAALIDGC